MAVNFESGKDLEKLRKLKREAQEAILEKAEKDYNKRKAKKELAKLKGEDTWMLPELEAQLSGKKAKKSKKDKKEKKKKNKKHKKEKCSDSSDSDEWVEKTSESAQTGAQTIIKTSEAPLKREDWMNVPSHLPTFSKLDLSGPKRKSMGKEEELAKKLMMEKPGQTSRELNPYWKDGGTGLPPEKDAKEERSKSEKISRSRSRSRSREKYTSAKPSRTVSPEKKRFKRPSESEDHVPSGSKYSSKSTPAWKKAKEPVTQKRYSSSSSSSESEEEAPSRSETSNVPEKIWTEQELNTLNAKIIKAEIMGQQGLVSSLKRTLEEAKEAIARQKMQGPSTSRDSVAVLTRVDSKGGQHPLPAPRYGEESLKGRGKSKKTKAETHEAGKRVRYFADDDKYSLNQMFQREKLDTAEDQNAMFARLAGNRVERTNEDFDLDDMFESRANRQVDEVAEEAKERERAIAEHQRREKVLDTCQYCLGSEAIQKHLIIAIGQKCYLSLPAHESLVDGHCLIIPRSHVTCATQLDEDVWEEMQAFRSALTKMFEASEADAIFFESAMRLKRFPHMVLECVPLPLSAGETAPIYFKKALLECESEWAMNKKVIDLKGKDVRRGVPKGLPYFCVDFGMQPGFAHIVEDEQRFPDNFAQEIIGGILDLDAHLWRRPRRENFDQQRRKVLEFAGQWKQYDFTSSLTK